MCLKLVLLKIILVFNVFFFSEQNVMKLYMLKVE